MAQLYGNNLTRREISRRSGMLSQFGGVRLMELGDGVERGVRFLEFRTGAGLRFTVLIDRAFDIADLEYNGAAVGWHSPSGFRNPGLHEYEGEGGLAFLRSFSGLLVTCGLDHTLFMHSDSAEHYIYKPRKSVESSLHGRISTIPGKLVAYGEKWEGEECVLYCEGIVQQSAVFGEDLYLYRRIETRLGAKDLIIKDRVVNHGFYRTPHMLCYHINVGYPVLAEGSLYVAPIKEVLWAAHEAAYEKQEVGYRILSGPKPNFHEQVWEHRMSADADGKIPVALINEKFRDGDGLGFLVEVDEKEFPSQFQWQNLQEGQYAMGIEPSTNHVLGKGFAQERGELIWLEHDDERSYTSRLTVLSGREEISQVKQRIQSISRQPEEDFPKPTGNWQHIAV
jgi:hypothetical protein